MENINWLFQLKNKTPRFLDQLKSKKNSGFFHYSLTGDLYDESIKWGLGNTVFATKIYYTLDLLDEMSSVSKKSMADFIKSFQVEDQTIHDPLIERKAFSREKLSAIKNLSFGNFFHQETKRAETRQSICALSLLGEKINVFKKFPKTKKEIERYLSALNWRKPWGAGSHFSHLLFFLNNSNLKNKAELIDFTINWINKLQNPKDGSWYKGNPNLQQKINGAMKIITGLKIVDKINFQYPEKLIDLCLCAQNDKQACDNFNIIYVLHYANEVVGKNYKLNNIKKFAQERLKIYQDCYYPQIGGFSFLPHRANIYYYGAKITKGLNEPDIHGTCMFLWGISIIAQILDINDKLKFNEQIS